MKIATQLQTITKRAQLCAVATVLAMGSLAVLTPRLATAMGGDGEPTWIIQNCNDLRDMYLGVSAFTSGNDYELAGNIDCDGVSMGSIGFGSYDAFTGTLDGKGYTISNLTLGGADAEEVGLFYSIEGTIQNLTLANVDVTGRAQIGTLAAYTNGATIENVHVTSGTVTGTGDYEETEYYAYGIGGLVGDSSGSAYTDVTTNVTVDAPLNGEVGGLIGYSYEDDILRAGTYGTVLGGQNVGGLVGYSDESSLFWVHSKGSVTGNRSFEPDSEGNHTGGLVGYLNGGSVASAYATGEVFSNGDFVGGLVGTADSMVSISYSYVANTVGGGEGGGYGFVGNIQGDDVEIDTTNFWDNELGPNGSGDPIGAGEQGKNTAEMKTLSTFTDEGWDFEDEPIWGLLSTFNDGYPCHAWESGCEVSSGNNNEENQPNVANITSATGGKAITLTVDESCTLSDVSAINSVNTTAKDAGYTYATGFVQFTATGCDDNTAHVQLLYHGVSPDDLTVRKYNPAKGSFFTITGATMTKVEGGTLVSYTIEDNGDLDINDTPNVITDPVGLGSLGVGAPNTGLGGRN